MLQSKGDATLPSLISLQDPFAMQDDMRASDFQTFNHINKPKLHYVARTIQ